MDAVGFTFKEAIFAGCKNIDAEVGVYAGSLSSYETFAALFDQIIEQWHDYTVGYVLESNLDSA